MKFGQLALAGSACLLSSCGGGGSGGGVASTPIPPPPPPSPAYSSLMNPVASIFHTSSTQESIRRYANDWNSVRELNASSSPVSTGITVDYQPANGKYILSDGSSTVEFDQSHGGTPSYPGGPISYVKPIPSSVVGETDYEHLFIYNDKQPQFTTTYSSIIWWASNRVGTVNPTPSSGLATRYTNRFATIGYETVSSDIPRTGFAGYNGLMVGVYTKNGDISLPPTDPNRGYVASIQGNAIIDVNFATGSVSPRMDIYITDVPTANVTGAGTIGAGTSRFSGTLISANPNTNGTFQGGFYGPRAVEIGYDFLLNHEGGVVTGAVVGKSAAAGN